MENSKEQIEGKCGLCNSEATLACSKCRSTYYCNKNCQKSHWKVHKKTCMPPLAKEDQPPKEIVQEPPPQEMCDWSERSYCGKKFYFNR